MNVTKFQQQAKQILLESINEVENNEWEPKGEYSDKIKTIILGTHLTYRYILLNGILAKATNEDCNPIVLQAGSELDGAFDARSLCHDVVVKVERKYLGMRLGASNEPFLNKPARYKELSSNNAVRRGNDKLILLATIEVLKGLKSSELALTSLKDCIYWVFQRESRNLSDYLTGHDISFQQVSLIKFAQDLLSVSIEGETCALLAGITFELIGLTIGRDFDVKTHKVNQAGTSSNEVSDIDVYENKVLIYTAEVKDKIFSPQDVEHAVSKVVMEGHRSLIFIKGPRGELMGDSEDNLKQKWCEQGFNLYFVDIIDYFTSILSITPLIEQDTFISFLNYHADLAKVKDQTFSHLTESIKKQNW